MRQHLNIREHSWRGNAPLILIVALKSPRLPRYSPAALGEDGVERVSRSGGFATGLSTCGQRC